MLLPSSSPYGRLPTSVLKLVVSLLERVLLREMTNVGDWRAAFTIEQANMAAAMMQQQSGYGNYMMMGMPAYQQALVHSMHQVAARHQAAAHHIDASVQQQVHT